MLAIIAVITLILVILLLFFIAFVIVPKIDLRDLHKKFNALELNSSWIQKTKSTDPFSISVIKVRVIAKQMGTDGKTPWIIIERPSGYKDHMKFEDFIKIYTQI